MGHKSKAYSKDYVNYQLKVISNGRYSCIGKYVNMNTLTYVKDNKTGKIFRTTIASLKSSIRYHMLKNREPRYKQLNLNQSMKDIIKSDDLKLKISRLRNCNQKLQSKIGSYYIKIISNKSKINKLLLNMKN